MNQFKKGLGIDAGGTYTDAVLFDYLSAEVNAKAKALTTKWQYSLGITEVVRQIPEGLLTDLDLVCLSTTLVTNAIVESNTYPVGLFVMPPGQLSADEVGHSPSQVIKGRMTIEGKISEDIDPQEIRFKAERMIHHHGVRAFAVSGYGGSVNPALELEVKKILRDSTGLEVCCGHELSGGLNFFIRARTAVLNAGVIPVMEEFLDEIKIALRRLGIKAPLVIVRGDGSLMSGEFAGAFPVQAALSGPAASMAGARYLTGLDEALVADVGGTTTDIGFLEDSAVSICDEGASIGNWKTHIRAVDMITTGLGGDSEILYDRLQWQVGPRRISPFCWLAAHYPLKDFSTRIAGLTEKREDSLIPLQWLFCGGKVADFKLTAREEKIMALLKEGPLMIGELGEALCGGVWKLLNTRRLEKAGCLQRAGLTPTDLYHLKGQLSLWPCPSLETYFAHAAGSFDGEIQSLSEKLESMISDQAAQALLKRIFPESSRRERSNLLGKGNDKMAVQLKMSVPLIGLGAPASLVLKDAAQRLDASLILPEHGDVANAVGAVTSRVAVTSSASVIPTVDGLFRIQGFAHNLEDLDSLEEAEEQCIRILKENLIQKARRAGTSSSAVSIRSEKRTAEAAGGDLLFLEKQFSATLQGLPDLV